MKKAIIHEWFLNYTGSERCVESFTNIYPDADIFCLLDFLSEADKTIVFKDKLPQTTFIQKLPFARKHHSFYLPLFPIAMEQIDLTGYDIILSSSHSVAKGVLTRSDQLHVCYCHTPMRYAWDLYHQYIKEAGLSKGIKGMWAKYILHKMRLWDLSTVNRVNYFIANSEYIAKRIKKVYNRDAAVIYPPVDVHKFSCEKNKENYYVAASRFVPYKKMDILIQAFTEMPDKKLIVIGDGPDAGKLKSIAGKNIELVGFLNSEKMKEIFQKAKALVFAAEEDFGITVVEALACGTPVIALDKGGTAETVIHGKNGIHFSHQSAGAVKDAVKLFESMENKFDPEEIRNSSLRYSRDNFETNIKNFIDEKAVEFFKE